MKYIAKTLFILSSFLVISCGVTPERKPATPKGSEIGTMPWNTPGANEGQGALGGNLSR